MASAVGKSFGPHDKSGRVNDDRGKSLMGNTWTPGPGNYSIDQSGRNGPAYSMSTKPKNKDNNWQPGPGTYEYTKDPIKADSRASLIGKSLRPDLTGSAAGKGKDPGPGAYNISGGGFS